MVKARTENMN